MAVKQEQEQARTEVVEVAPGVLRMQLPIEMPGLGHVNMYCLLDEQGAAVVDPGLPGEESWQAICERLAQADLRVRDVHTVIVTHSHPDHFGGAARFRAEAECRVIAHQDFSVFGRPPAPEVSVEDLDAHRQTLAEQRGPRPVPEADDTEPQAPPWLRDPHHGRTPWGGERPAPSEEQRKRWMELRSSGHGFLPRITHVVGEGDVVRLADRDWFVRFTPGHTADHICLHDPDQGIFLAGDHVLPTITPHISGLGATDDPLQSFYDSLDEVARIEHVSTCLPAHGHPFDDLRARARAIRKHHDERLAKIEAIARQLGPTSVQQISQELFHPRSWGPMAESETYAHLEHLRLRRKADRYAGEGGVMIYVV